LVCPSAQASIGTCRVIRLASQPGSAFARALGR
jgi:hypothetical protein